MKIVDKKITELKAYENNPRHNDNAVDAVAESIKEFGFKVPIIIDIDGVIVAGHTRAKAAEKLGLKTVPCIVADDLSPEQVQAFRLADNKVGELATWDFAKLEQELAELTDIDMSLFGFEAFEDAFGEVELDREQIGTSENMASLKYGSKTIPLTAEEDAIFGARLSSYLDENGTYFGFISELLGV